MRRRLALAGLAAFAATAFSATPSIAATGVSTNLLAGPSGYCLSYSAPSPSSVIGTAQLSQSRQGIDVSVKAHGLPTGTYTVWVVDLTMSGGQIIGCSAYQVGSATVSAAGQLRLSGSTQLP